MKIPQYVSVEEVKRVCKELSISDWTKKKAQKVSLKETKVVLTQLIPKTRIVLDKAELDRLTGA